MQESTTFVGLDVHSDSIAIAVLRPNASMPDVRMMGNDPTSIRRTFTKLKEKGTELRCCYEAGPCGFDTHRQLTDLGIHCDVIAPSLIPKKPGERIKTDRRDAAKLVRLYRSGDLTAINVPTPEQEAVRDLVRAREQIRRDLIVARHRLAKFLIRYGRIYRSGARWTDRHWKWIRSQQFDHEPSRVVYEYLQLQIHHLLERRAEIEKLIVEIARSEPYRDNVARLSCMRGIATLGAMVLLTEIRDFRRFAHPRQLMAFVGLVPNERSSGQKQRRGHITKCGNSHVRHILVEAAWHHRNPASIGPRVLKLMPGQPPEAIALVKKAQWRLVKRYRQLVGHGKKPQVAVTAVAREMCGFIWALMNTQAA